jgi:asparagine synthetase B (glutamine-hydrolysing)
MQYYLDLVRAPEIKTPLLGVWAPFDRTRTLFDCPHIDSLMPIGAPTQTKSFADICDQRAVEILTFARAAGQVVKVLWSGGIDSTTALVALLKHADPSELLVVYSDESLGEYRWFFENMLAGKIPTLDMFSVDKSLYEIMGFGSGGISCTGELGDQLFGSMLYFEPTVRPNLLKDWRTVIKPPSPAGVQRFEEFVAACPLQIRTTKEFLWWYAYAVKYQTVCLRSLYLAPNVVLERNVFHFFYGKEFNDWAVSVESEAKLYKEDMTTYKQVAKEYIFSYTKDDDYRKNKLKLPSGLLMKPLYLANHYKRISVDWVWS